MSKSKRNLALVGCGYWGKNLLRVFNELGVLKIIFDENRKLLEEKAIQNSHLKVASNFEDILQDKKIKAIVIASPAVTHYKIAKQAILAGKDVFIEKPLALSVSEGKELVTLADKKKRILMVGHLLHYHPAILEMEKIVKNGKIGNIRYIVSHRLNFGKLRKEENVLWSFAPHDISIIKKFLGMPDSVISSGRSFLNTGVPDITMSILNFNNGKGAHIFVSWLNPFKEQKLTIVGEKGMLVFDDQVKDKLVLYNHSIRWNADCPEAVKADLKIIRIKNSEPLLEEAKHFISCIKNRKTPKTDGKEAFDVLRILDACQRSIIKNGVVTKLL